MVYARQGGVSCSGSDKNKKWTRPTNTKEARWLNVRKENEKNAKVNAIWQILVSLDEKVFKKRSKYEKPSELSKEIEKCVLIEVMKGGFL